MNDNRPKAMKRKLSTGQVVPTKIKKKNAVCTLHEMYRGLVFKVVEVEGPVHMPMFTISVEVNGSEYKGQGKNKKIAKQAAAEAALRSIIQLENPSDWTGTLQCATDFTTDVCEAEISDFKFHTGPALTTPDVIESNGSSGPLTIAQNSNIKAKLVADKGPVMLLNELHPNATFEIVSENGEQYNKYTTAVTIDGQRFEGTGASKKLSKAAASRCALATLHNLTFSYSPTPTPAGQKLPVTNEFEIPQIFADHVANIVTQKFANLLSEDKEHARRKVLAGLVLSHGLDATTCRVLSVATGTKCIKGEHMSFHGATIYDCHAEIIARRCFKKFLYDELKKHSSLEVASDSIFKPFQQDVGFELKDGLKFHLFITTAPCGDSRIFSPHDNDDSEDKHPNRKARGKLRTKIESGEGTIPVKCDEPVQTWDGIIQGERLLTMSCSDKIAKWNVLGLQGSLLSLFMKPIYLESIILGSLFHPEHLHRAVIGRVQLAVLGLPCPYRLNKPKMALISSKEVRNTGKAPNFSVNWAEGDVGPEIVNTMTGKTEDHQVSRLAKKVFFTKFVELVGILPSISPINLSNLSPSYGENKERCMSYQMAKKELYDAFVRAGQGMWVKKPPEAEQFEMTLVPIKQEPLSNTIVQGQLPLLSLHS